MINDLLRAIAELIKAAAWPGVVLYLAYVHRRRVDELLSRLRELMGAKFDPQVTTQEVSTSKNPIEDLQSLTPSTGAPPEIGPGGGDAIPPEVEALRTPAVRAAETTLLRIPEVAALTDPRVRQQTLLTLASALMVFNTFERMESGIWASQLALLQFLNAIPPGVPPARLKEEFYDRAASQFPPWYADYTFEGYLNFLASFGAINNGPPVTITETGREYLFWRLQQRKAPKVAG